MSYSSIEEFHILADNILIRDRSLLDLMTKLQDTTSKLNRTIAKSITQCGCLELYATKQTFPVNLDFSTLSHYTSSHIHGELCPRCHDFIEQAIGDNLFYLTCLCNLFHVSLEDIIQRELGQLTLLGKFNLK